VSNVVVFSEADGFLDKVFVDRETPVSSEIHLRYLPIIFKDFSGPMLPEPPGPPQPPGISIAWPPSGASVIVEKDLTDEANDYRLTIHGMIRGAKPGWTILVEVFTDNWYPQGTATVKDGLWGARVSLNGQGAQNYHKIRVTLQDEKGTPITSAIVDNIVRINPCNTP
jgi:hypothetical protein